MSLKSVTTVATLKRSLTTGHFSIVNGKEVILSSCGPWLTILNPCEGKDFFLYFKGVIPRDGCFSPLFWEFLLTNHQNTLALNFYHTFSNIWTVTQHFFKLNHGVKSTLEWHSCEKKLVDIFYDSGGFP